MLRVFIGIELSPEVQAGLAEQIDRLRRHASRVRWVREENLHITLKFIGNVVPDELPDVFAAAERSAGTCDPFSLEICGLGCFPDLRRPRIAWAGCGSGCEACRILAGNIETEFAKIGYKPEHRTFHPHVTLGRIRTPGHAMGLENALQESGTKCYGQTDVSELVVFMSELKRSGAVYTPMQRVKIETRGNPTSSLK